MSRKRPSGPGSNSKRFAEVRQADGTTLKVPAVKDVGTFLYLADADGNFPNKPLATILDSAPELQEGTLFEIEEGAAGRGMGNIIGAKVVLVRLRVGVDRSGKYSKFGQLKRLVYVVEVPNFDELAHFSANSELEEDA